MKNHRTPRGYTVVNLIQAYWRSVERRGYDFSPGEWRAAHQEDGRQLVSFTYGLDDASRSMEWWHDPDGAVEPANEDARALVG